MNPSAASADPHGPAPLRIQIRADGSIYEGNVQLAGFGQLQALLNDPRPFLDLTDVIIQDQASATPVQSAWVALNKGAITHVVALGVPAVAARPSPPAPAPAAAPASPPAAAAPVAASPAAVAAAPAPAVPDRGSLVTTARPPVPRNEKTLPGPVPAPVTTPPDPPTQPYPEPVATADDDDVADLILDDDDDIDPADLQRDVGALISH